MMPNISLRLAAIIGTGALIMLLVIALFATRATLSDVKRERDLAETKLKVSNSSISRLENEVDKALQQQIELANGDQNRIAASKQALAIVEAAEGARQAIIDRLTASASVVRTIEAKCEFSDEVKKAWP